MSTHVYKLVGKFTEIINSRSVAGDILITNSGESDARIYTLGKYQYKQFIKEINTKIRQIKKEDSPDIYEIESLKTIRKVAISQFKKYGYFEFAVM